MMMVAKKLSVALDTRLEFPDEVVAHRCGDDFVLVVPANGNWLVVSEAQRKIFEQLRLGKTVGEVLAMSKDKEIAVSLLRQIFARDFTEERPLIARSNSKALFYLTYDCNLRCEHCYMYAQKEHEALLSADEYGIIFKDLKTNGVDEITFSGGEPLVRSDLWGIVRRAHDAGLAMRIFSNGTLWTDSDIEKANTFSVKVQISIDGVDEYSSAVIRGAGAFTKAKDVAIRLAEAGVDVEIATTPTLANIAAVERGYANFVNEIRRRVGRRIKFKVSLDLMPGRNVTKMTLQEQQEYTQRGNRIYAIANPEGIKIPFFDEYKKKQGRVACGLGRLVFSPDGFVHVCSRLDFLRPIGNVRNVSVQRLLKEAKKFVAAVSVDNTIPCRDCSLRHICGGGCRAERYEYVSGSVDRPSVHKPCSESQKMSLIKKMVQAMKECYVFEGVGMLDAASALPRTS